MNYQIEVFSPLAHTTAAKSCFTRRSAPFNHGNAQFRGQRRIAGGRANLRSVLYMAALVASRHNPVLKVLYQRLLAAGKAKKLALTALMRKLIILSNRLLTNRNFSLAT